MSIVLANAKKAKLLQQKVGFLNGCTYRLFVSNITPTGATPTSAFTEPTTDTAYNPAAPAFAPATLNGSNQGETDSPTLTFNFSLSGGGFTVYGYFVTDNFDNQVVFSERAASPFAVTAAGQTYSVQPRVLEDTM